MQHNPQFQFGEEGNTPKSLIYLIAAIATTSISATLFSGFFTYFFNSLGPENWLSLSLSGISHFFIWQPITYLFIYNSEGSGITISYLIGLSINLYILWLLGSSIIERIGQTSFFKLYFGSGVLSALVSLLFMKITGQNIVLSGFLSALLALLTFWTMLYKEADLRLFVLFEFKAKWLLAAIFIGLLLSALSHFDLPTFMLYFTGALCGYLYGILGYGLKSPFLFLDSFENFLLKIFKKRDESEGKIIDFRTGKALDDEIFVDAMLAKISKHGEDSLTFYEKRRLNEISKRKK
ncbi:MAG TPA: rhomboid family intramembrane serine protease [Parachlamydiaceae bacterium]|nr:rhomboid family intramembrane serine protease [Parachlamydiaceae bacterium]